MELYNRFCHDAMLDSNRSAWKKRRKDSCVYSDIIITSKGHDFGSSWKTWWEDYIGCTCFCRLSFRTVRGVDKLDEAFPVRLTSTLIHEGRGIPVNSFSIC